MTGICEHLCTIYSSFFLLSSHILALNRELWTCLNTQILSAQAYKPSTSCYLNYGSLGSSKMSGKPLHLTYRGSGVLCRGLGSLQFCLEYNSKSVKCQPSTLHLSFVELTASFIPAFNNAWVQVLDWMPLSCMSKTEHLIPWQEWISSKWQTQFKGQLKNKLLPPFFHWKPTHGGIVFVTRHDPSSKALLGFSSSAFK